MNRDGSPDTLNVILVDESVSDTAGVGRQMTARIEMREHVTGVGRPDDRSQLATTSLIVEVLAGVPRIQWTSASPSVATRMLASIH